MIFLPFDRFPKKINFMITTSIKDRIFYITLNRPDKRNSLNSEMVRQLREAFAASIEDKETKIVVLKAVGNTFSAGADLDYLQKLQKNTFDENLEDSTGLMELFKMIYNHCKVTVAQVEGFAIAGGCGLATVCDFIFATPEAKFGYTEVKIGFVPAIVMFFLLRKIGEGRARELMLTGKLIPAAKAQEMGLINFISDSEKIEDDVAVFCQKLVNETSTGSVRIIKEMISKIQHLDTKSALEYAARTNALARETADCKRGIAAFLNKEELKW
jgi:methylglutaconyl-CoA hydratase